jgi:hypothetical protein
MSTPGLNRLDIINQFTVLLLGQMLFGFTDFVSNSEAKYVFGSIFIFLFGIHFIINISYLLLSLILPVLRGIFRRFRRSI